MPLDEGALAKEYRDRVVYFVLRRVRDRTIAEEIAQATMLVLIEAIRGDRIRDAESVGSFIFGVANNLVRAHRRERSKQDGSLTIEEASSPAVWGDDPEAALLLAEKRRLVGEALGKLGREDRELLIRLSHSSRAPQVIADEFGISWPALRKRKSRALARLREVLEASQKSRQ